MRKYLWLLVAPFPVWIVWGAAVQLNPDRSLDYFPYFWVASDLAIVMAFGALLLWATGYGKTDEAPDVSSGAAEQGARGGHGHP